MRDVTLAVVRVERQRNSLDPDRRIAAPGTGEDVGQHVIAALIVGNQSTPGRAQDVGLREYGKARGICMHDAAGRLNEQHARADAVEGVRKGGGFRRLLLDHLADKRGAANMRHDQSQASARLLVDEPVARMAKDHEGSAARR